jgi:hypothetical protein
MEKDDIIEIGEYYKEKIKEIPSNLKDFGKNIYRKFINSFKNTKIDEKKEHDIIMDKITNLKMKLKKK